MNPTATPLQKVVSNFQYETMNPLESLAPSQKRKLYELCWQFEDAWTIDRDVSPNDWASKIDDIDPAIVLGELTETLSELETRIRSQRQMSKLDSERYEFIEEIARGGVAVVWRVQDHHLNRQTAVKYLMDSQDNRQMRTRLRREAKICAQLVHPGIVPIYELSSFLDGRPFVCMKLIEGNTLLQLLKASPVPSLENLVDIFTKACQAIAYAHGQNIIHRDLTPSNIMVGSFGEVQIMDWGLAKDLTQGKSELQADDVSIPDDVIRSTSDSKRNAPPLSESLTKGQDESTRVGSVFGTIAYLSPEQAAGQVDQIDKRSDVFSLGAILCRLITGTAPYQNADQQKMLSDARNAETHAAIERLANSKHRLLSDLAIRCLSSDPNLRPKDAAELVTELERIRAATNRHKTALRLSVAVISVLLFVAYSFVAPTFHVSSNAPKTEPPKPLQITNPAVVQSLLNAGETKLVLDSYPGLLKNNPHDVGLHFLIGSALFHTRRLEEAEALANKTIQLDASYPDHHILLSNIHCFQGRLREARESLNEAKRRYELGLSPMLSAQDKLNRLEKQLSILERLEAANGNLSVETAELKDVGKICEVTGKVELAAKYFNQMLEEQPDPGQRSIERYPLLTGFVKQAVARSDLSIDRKEYVYRVGLDWLQEDFNFAVQEDSSFASPKKPQKRVLLQELKQGSLASVIEKAIVDPNISSQLRAEFHHLQQKILASK